jgi:hypothetical protein
LTPGKNYSPLKFTPEVDIDNIVDSFRINFENYGKQFFEKNSTLNGIRESLENKLFFRPAQTEYRLAVCYFLLREYDETKKYLKMEIEKMKNNNPASQEFIIFSKKLIEVIDRQNEV